MVICELPTTTHMWYVGSTHIVWCLNILKWSVYFWANWLIVEYAITFLISCWNNPIRELNTVVIAPNHKHNNNTVELYSIKGDERINKYTPAVTIVAACIKAETGVGKIVDS